MWSSYSKYIFINLYNGGIYNGYPADFDLIAANEGIIAIIRSSKLIYLIEIANYNFSNAQTINKDGFYININSQQDYIQYINEIKSIDSSVELANKWLNVTRFRQIKFKEYDLTNDWNI